MKHRLSKELICLISLWLIATLCLLGKSNSFQKYWTQRHHTSLPLETPLSGYDAVAQDTLDNYLQKGALAFLTRQDPNEFAVPDLPAVVTAQSAAQRARKPAAVVAAISTGTASGSRAVAAGSAATNTGAGNAASAATALASGSPGSSSAITGNGATNDSATAHGNASVPANAVAGVGPANASGPASMSVSPSAVLAGGEPDPAAAALAGKSGSAPAGVVAASIAGVAGNAGPATATGVANSEVSGENAAHYGAGEKLALSKSDKILFAGDSLMQGLVPHITRGLRRDGFSHYLDASKQSTGFSYPATFDWPGKIKTAIVRDGVNTVVIFIGANDAWSLASGGKLYSFGSPPWKAEYTRRVREVVQFAHQHKARVMWLELPPMHYDNLTKGRQLLNDIYRQVAQEESAMFVPTTRVVSDDQEKFGLFKTLADGKVAQTRMDDGVHFTKLGQTLISKVVLQHFTVQEAQQ